MLRGPLYTTDPMKIYDIWNSFFFCKYNKFCHPIYAYMYVYGYVCTKQFLIPHLSPSKDYSTYPPPSTVCTVEYNLNFWRHFLPWINQRSKTNKKFSLRTFQRKTLNFVIERTFFSLSIYSKTLTENNLQAMISLSVNFFH